MMLCVYLNLVDVSYISFVRIILQLVIVNTISKAHTLHVEMLNT